MHRSLMSAGAAALALAALPLAASAQDATRLLRAPDLSDDHLVFMYAGDLWLADRDGSDPRRLTTHPAEETGPMFSPDGTKIAFNASYDGQTDVYVIDVAGGQPKRLTWHPGNDEVVDWSPDGTEVAFVSRRETDHGRSGQLFHVSVDGGFPVKQMEARFAQGRYDANGERLAYIDHISGYNGLFGGSSGWQGYRGGTTPSIRVLDIDGQSFIDIPGDRVNDFNPMWVDGDVFFLSDRENERFNLFRFDPDTERLSQVTFEATWDIRAASAHDGTLVYEAGGELRTMDVASGESTTLAIALNPDLPQLRGGWTSVASTIDNIDVSPTGQRAIITARGDVFTVPADKGPTRNLTTSQGQREYWGMWSPDGEQVAWLVESLDGQTLVVADQFGEDAREYELGTDFYTLRAWHADTGRLVYSDNHLRLFAIDLDDGEIERIATNERRAGYDVSFSPDGRFLAHTLEKPNYHADLVVHDFESGESTTISNGMADVAAPAFSPDGKFLYFAASTNSGPLQVGLNMTSQERPYRAGIYAAVLTADGDSPLAPRSDDEPVGDETDADEDKDENGKDEEKETPATVIDFDGLQDRIVGLPVAEGNYRQLQVAGDGNLYYIEAPQPGSSNEPPGTSWGGDNQLFRFDFEEREATVALTGVRNFRIAAGGKHMILDVGNGPAIAEIGDTIEPKPVDTSGLRMDLDPRAEWAQIFDEGWRMQQQYFYADNLHGADWDAVYAQYRPLVDHVGRREDLNTLMVEMIAELQAGHNRVGGGDVYRGEGANTGLLGANFTIDDGRYRIGKVYSGESWNPFLRGPLAEPGNEARVGEYLLAINGEELTADDNLFERLQNTADKQVVLTVGARADGRDSRDITVMPTDGEGELRLWNWIETNRKAVDEATDGRIGYIYLPNTAGAGYTFFNRYFFSQLDKDGLIVDERSNGGGQAANYIVEVLSRKHLSSWVDRDGTPYNTPAGAMHGPKVMLIDQDAGSGGDYLPYAFRELGIGKLIGTRTWGGLIGIFTNPRFVDGGVMTVPFFRFVDTDGEWSIENEGVAPDIEVELDPVATNNGRDTQLERAIEQVLMELETYESPVPPIPALPTELGE